MWALFIAQWAAQLQPKFVKVNFHLYLNFLVLEITSLSVRLSALACLEALNIVKDRQRKGANPFLPNHFFYNTYILVLCGPVLNYNFQKTAIKIKHHELPSKFGRVCPGLNRPLSNMKSCKMSGHLSQGATSKSFWYEILFLP